MKSYGVNWFLVWVGLLLFMWPLSLWLKEVIFFHWNPTFPASAQAIAQSFCWTFLYYLVYSGTLADPAKLERLRQNLQRSQVKQKRPCRRLRAGSILFLGIAGISLICRLLFHHPSWPQVVGYSLLLPVTSLFGFWLVDKSAEKGQLAKLLKDDETAT